MKPPRYIVVGDQGDVYRIEGELTPDDLEFAATGMRTIIRLSDAYYFGHEGTWLPAEESELAYDDEIPNGPYYHFPRSWVNGGGSAASRPRRKPRSRTEAP